MNTLDLSTHYLKTSEQLAEYQWGQVVCLPIYTGLYLWILVDPANSTLRIVLWALICLSLILAPFTFMQLSRSIENKIKAQRVYDQVHSTTGMED